MEVLRLMGFTAAALRLEEDEATATGLGESAGMSLLTLSADALRRLAARWFDELEIAGEYSRRYYGGDLTGREMDAIDHLYVLQAVMGAAAFQALMVEKGLGEGFVWGVSVTPDIDLRCPTCRQLHVPDDGDVPAPILDDDLPF